MFGIEEFESATDVLFRPVVAARAQSEGTER